MTQNFAIGQKRGFRRMQSKKRQASPLSLRQPVPADWHHDRPAFAGDPFMDWESKPEPPREPEWGITEHRQRPANQ